MFRLILPTACVCLLLLHLTDGAALGEDCSADNTCTVTNSDCNSDTSKCECSANYQAAGDVCKLKNDQTCTEDADCASGHCIDNNGAKTCGTEQDTSGNNDNNDENNDDNNGDGGSGSASGIAASLVLLLMALVTSRFF